MSRALRFALPAFSTIALLATSAGDVAAQQALPTVPAPRVLATYQFGTIRPATVTLPLTVTVADSAGQLVAVAAIPGERAPRPFQVSVVESDLVLQGQTPEGVHTLVLEKQADGQARTLESGRWALESIVGTLRARR